jgi:hypothetical protein
MYWAKIAPMSIPDVKKKITLLCIASAPWLGLNAENTNIVENQWVWRNGQLVLLPKLDKSPISKDAIASANQIKVDWREQEGKALAKTSQQQLKTPPQFDPYLLDIPVAEKGHVRAPRFTSPRKLADHTLIKPEFRDGTLPERLKVNSKGEEELNFSQSYLSRKATQTELSPNEIRTWGVQLQKKSKELQLNYSTLIKSDIPDNKLMKEYLVDSEQLRLDLELYRYQISLARRGN